MSNQGYLQSEESLVKGKAGIYPIRKRSAENLPSWGTALEPDFVLLPMTFMETGFAREILRNSYICFVIQGISRQTETIDGKQFCHKLDLKIILILARFICTVFCNSRHINKFVRILQYSCREIYIHGILYSFSIMVGEYDRKECCIQQNKNCFFKSF